MTIHPVSASLESHAAASPPIDPAFEEMARKAAENPLLEPFPITEQDCPSLNGLLDGLVTAEGFLRSTPADLPPDRFEGNPHMAGMDGFFAARFKRRA